MFLLERDGRSPFKNPLGEASHFFQRSPDFREIGGKEEAGLSQRVIATYFAHDRWRKANQDGKNYEEPLIDSALVTAQPLRIPLSPEEAINRFKADLSTLQRANLKPRPDLICLQASLEATVAYLEEEQGKKDGKELTPYAEYLKKTIHLEPYLIPEKRLVEGQRKLIELLKQAGYDDGDCWNKEENLKSAYMEFKKDHQIVKLNQLKSAFEKCDQKTRETLTRIFGQDPIPLYAQQYISKSEWWKMETIVRETGYTLRVNYNERVADQWLKGVPYMYALHELGGHFAMYAALKECIDEGKINWALGISTLVDPRAFLNEGLAQTLHLFLDIKLPLTTQIALAESDLKLLAITQGFTLIGFGEDPKKAAKEVARYYPFYTLEQIEKELTGGNMPLDRAYRPNYGFSLLAFEQMAEQLTPKQRMEFVRAVYPSLMTPRQVWQAFEAIRDKTPGK